MLHRVEPWTKSHHRSNKGEAWGKEAKPGKEFKVGPGTVAPTPPGELSKANRGGEQRGWCHPGGRACAYLANSRKEVLKVTGADASSQLHAEDCAGIPLLRAQTAQRLPVGDEVGVTHQGNSSSAPTS